MTVPGHIREEAHRALTWLYDLHDRGDLPDSIPLERWNAHNATDGAEMETIDGLDALRELLTHARRNPEPGEITRLLQALLAADEKTELARIVDPYVRGYLEGRRNAFRDAVAIASPRETVQVTPFGPVNTEPADAPLDQEDVA